MIELWNDVVNMENRLRLKKTTSREVIRQIEMSNNFGRLPYSGSLNTPNHIAKEKPITKK